MPLRRFWGNYGAATNAVEKGSGVHSGSVHPTFDTNGCWAEYISE